MVKFEAIFQLLVNCEVKEKHEAKQLKNRHLRLIKRR
jgi:hypothetical protein